jgi:hypothetical protein
MTGASQRQLVIEVERVQTVRRRIATVRGHCVACAAPADLIELADLARLFDVSIADAVLQLRRRRIHMRHMPTGSIVVCAESLLTRSDPDHAMLSKSLPPSSAAAFHLTTSAK